MNMNYFFMTSRPLNYRKKALKFQLIFYIEEIDQYNHTYTNNIYNNNNLTNI